MPGEEFDYFGWEGVSFEKPSAWGLSQVDGKAEKGSATLDDGLKCRLQLRWQKPGREADIERAAEKQRKAIIKKDRSAAAGLEVEDFRARTFAGKKFSLRNGGSETFYYMLQCRDCLQVILIGVFGSRGEGIEEVCGKIIASLRDHARDGMLLWSVYGFSFKAPAGLELKKHELNAGDLGFEFSEGKELFFFRRVGLAGVILRKKGLSSWVMDYTQRKHPNVRIENVFESSDLHGGGVFVKGREMSRLKLFRKRFFNGCFWVPVGANSIVGAAEMTPGNGSRLDELVQGVGCN